jgi:hypothetical protein
MTTAFTSLVSLSLLLPPHKTTKGVVTGQRLTGSRLLSMVLRAQGEQKRRSVRYLFTAEGSLASLDLVEDSLLQLPLSLYIPTSESSRRRRDPLRPPCVWTAAGRRVEAFRAARIFGSSRNSCSLL